MIHTVGIIFNMLNGGALLFNVRSRMKVSIKGQNEILFRITKIIIGCLMLLTFINPWLGVMGLEASLILIFVNSQISLRMTSWHHLVLKVVCVLILIGMLF